MFPVLKCSAQSWFPPEAEWYYTSLPAGTAGAGHIHMTVGVDTMIVGTICTELKFAQALGNGQPPYTPFYTELPEMFVAQENGLIALLDQDSLTFDTLYNMNAVPGDHWGFPSLPAWMDCAGPLARFSVTDTGAMVIDGLSLRWLAVDLRYPVPWDMTLFSITQDTILERIGTLNTFFDPQDRCRSSNDFNIGGAFRCYTDADMEYAHQDPWWPWGGLECAYLPNSIEENSPAAFSLALNPSNGLLRIDIGASVPTTNTLSVFNARGQLAATRLLRDPITTLDLSDLPAGPYLIQIRTGAATHTQVWMKE